MSAKHGKSSKPELTFAQKWTLYGLQTHHRNHQKIADNHVHLKALNSPPYLINEEGNRWKRVWMTLEKKGFIVLTTEDWFKDKVTYFWTPGPRFYEEHRSFPKDFPKEQEKA